MLKIKNSMKASYTVYQLIKRKKDGSEKIVVETDASSVEKAMDYFFVLKPKAYESKKYRIGIKPKPEFILD